MLGHKWEPAEGTIVEVQSKQPHRLSEMMHAEHHYVIEVRMPTGAMIRGAVIEKSLAAHVVGQVVKVEVHSKNNEIRLDPNARVDSVSGMLGMAVQMRNQAAGVAGGGAGGLLGALGAGPVTPGVHMIDASSGQEIQVGGAQGAELQQLAQAMMSGDPAARQAAIERVRQIKADRTGQAAAQPTGSSTFDPIGPASTAGGFNDPVRETLSQPAAATPYSQPAAATPYSQPTPPSPYSQVTPPTSFGSPSAFGSFGDGGGAGAGGSQERIAKLQQLFDKGILTESEFQTQRQQVLNGG